MQLKNYNELVKSEEHLKEEMKNLIIITVEKAGGRITYTPSEEIGDYQPLEELYPIITTLYGRKWDYKIAITDVYIDKSDPAKISIYADGIDADENSKKKGFEIYPEHYSDILYFIYHPIKNNLQEFAEKLAIKDSVDNFDKLPFELFTENKTIKAEFRDFYWEKRQHYQEKLEELYIKCSDPNSDKDEINSDIMNYICELADLALIEQTQKPIEELVDDNEDDDATTFKEEFQDNFNGLYDDIESQLWEVLNFDGV